MLHPLIALAAAPSPHDAGIRQIAALSARIAYVLTCLALCWGIFVSTGWLHKLCGRQATRSSHMVFVTLALAFGASHVMCFLFLTDRRYDLFRLTVPLLRGGLFRHALGIIGYEFMIAIALSAMVQRFVTYRQWLRLHRLAYPAIGLIVVHSLFGAIANGHLALVWLGGLTLLAPTVMLTALRFAPPRMLVDAGLVEEEI